MSDIITVTGVVATPPRVTTVAGDLKIASFRLASGQRRFDKGRGRWVESDTNWYTITAFRQLAVNVGHSVLKGDRIVAKGRLRIKEWTSDGRKGTTIDVEADAVGHDLAWGTTAFTRVSLAAAAQAQEPTDSFAPQAGFASLPGDAWTTPLAPVGTGVHEGIDVHEGSAAHDGSGAEGGYGVAAEAAQLDAAHLDAPYDDDAEDSPDGGDRGRNDDDDGDDDDDSFPLQPSFSAVESTPF